MTAVVAFDVGGAAEPWRRIGLDVVDDVAWIGGVAIRFGRSGGGTGITSWTLAGAPHRPPTIDGLATEHTDDDAVEAGNHPLGATSFDHVVVMTASLERTCRAIEDETGEPLKRIREAGPVRQGFHRLGPVIVEVVESARVTSPAATFWGFVLVVSDISAATGRLGPELVALPKPAVQPGRLIASFRPAAELGLPVALMSP